MTKDSIAANSFTSQLLGILESLVNYGFYSTQDHLTIIPHLVDVIDGSTGKIICNFVTIDNYKYCCVLVLLKLSLCRLLSSKTTQSLS